MLQQYNVSEDLLVEYLEADYFTPMILEFIEQGLVEPYQGDEALEDFELIEEKPAE